MITFVWFFLTTFCLVVIGLVLGVFAACIQSSTISRMEEAMGRGDHDQEQEQRRREDA